MYKRQVILGYSAVEMLAEPIIRKLGTSFSKSWARRFGILCGVGFLAFGFVSKRILILPLMLVLPLLLKLPEYFVTVSYTHLMKRGQAVQLRNFVKRYQPGAFIAIVNSSEIIGKGFRGLN